MAVKVGVRKRLVKAGVRSDRGENAALCEVDCVNIVSVREARTKLPEDQTVASLAETFKTLGDPTRLRIVAALAETELCVCDLSTVLGVSQSAISHSLRALRQLRLVRYRKEGKIAYYTLDDDHIAVLLEEGLNHIDEMDLSKGQRKRA